MLQAVATLVDLTASPPAEVDEDDIVLVSVSESSQQPGSRLLAGCRRLSAAIPGLGAGPLLSKQAKTLLKSSPSPTAAPQAGKPGVSCGICMESLKDPGCGPCGYGLLDLAFP